MDRREVLGAAAAAGLLASQVAEASARPASEPRLADVSALRGKPLLDRERATSFMKREGLDAIVCCHAANIFQLTSHWPLLERMGASGSAVAILPADPRAPVALVMGQFSYYYGVIDDGLPPGVEPFLYTSPLGHGTDAGNPDGEPPAAAPSMFRVVDAAALQPRERARRAASEAAAPYSAGVGSALRRALQALRLSTGRLGADDWQAADALAFAAPVAQVVRAEDTLRRIRRVKTPNEVAIMRLVAQANAEAALAAARAAREMRTARALRARYYSEAVARGLRPVFMVVDGITSDYYDEPLREGQGLLIDCVSSLLNYHGDFARTVFMGEPSARMKLATRAIAECWDSVRDALRPGMSYSAIRALGASTLKKQGYDVQVGINPHGVGLWHGDDPRGVSATADPLLEEGMVLSVDFPMFDQGAGGTAHLEDLSLITANGAVLLNASTERTISV